MEGNNSNRLFVRDADGPFDLIFWPSGAARCDARFGFSLFFEHVILSLVPNALVLLLATPRLVQLYHERRKATGNVLLGLKMASWALYAGLELVLLVLWSKHDDALQNPATLAAATLAFALALALCSLSYLEHHRSVSPSSIISVYLTFTVVFDIVQCRTLWLMPDFRGSLAPAFLAMVASKALLLAFELQSKRKFLMEPWSQLPPESTSGVVNKSLYWWVNSLLFRGFRTMLSIDTLYDMDDQLGSARLAKRLLRIWHSKSFSRLHRYRLVLAVCYALKGPLALAVPPRLLLIGFKIAQPFLVKRVIVFVQQDSKQGEGYGDRRNVAWGLVWATFLVYLGAAIATGIYQRHLFRSITMIRGCLVGAVCIDSLSLNEGATRSVGSAILTLAGPDVTAISRAFENLHEIWANSIEIVLAMWLLGRELGPGCAGPAISVLIGTIAMGQLSKFMGPAMKAWNNAIQHRVSTSSSVIGCIKEVKMLGMIDSWLAEIQRLRVRELDFSKSFRTFIVYLNVLGATPSVLAPISTFGIAIAMYGPDSSQRLTIATVFTSLTIMSLIIAPLSRLLSSWPSLASSLGCFERIQAFLERCERSRSEPGSSDPSSLSVDNGPWSSADDDHELSLVSAAGAGDAPIISVTDASFSISNGEPPILHNITLASARGTLTILTGRVSSGKSMLLLGLIGELHATRPVAVRMSGIAYCAQIPWLVKGTIRSNVLGSPAVVLDIRWYDTVIKACALDHDLKQLPLGDLSPVGSKGLTLSGGQRHRVALARALYSRSTLMLVDDIFSALDGQTRRHVWENVFAPDGICRQNGVTVVLATHFNDIIHDADRVIVLDKGTIQAQGSARQLEKQLYMLKPVRSGDTDPGCSTREPDQEITTQRVAVSKDQADDNEIEDLKRRSGDSTLYLYYFKSIGWVFGSIAVCAGLASSVLQILSQIWIKWWAEDNMENEEDNSPRYLGIYSLLMCCLLVTIAFDCWFMFVRLLPRSAQSLHWTLISSMLRAPLSFFSSTDSGDLMNRLSQDMSLVDRDLPTALYTTFSDLLHCLTEAILVIMGAKYLALTIPLAIVVLYGLQKFYLRTSRQLRLLDLQCRAELTGHMMETANGLVTIRAFQWQSPVEQSALRLLDSSQKPHYLLYSIQRWLTLVLDLFVAASATVLVALALFTNTTSAGGIGVAMLNIMDFSGTLASLITSWTALETSLGAISRLRTFEATTPSETGHDTPPHDVTRLPQPWPHTGQVEIQQLWASYSDDPTLRPILRDISLSVRPGEKVAICGRTGSGKSTLLSAIFRLIDYTGTITFDDLDISQIPRDLLRSSLIAVPQEPVLFPGSIRSNLLINSGHTSPGQCEVPSDEQIIRLLERMGIWDVVSMSGGLDLHIEDLALSHGQKQLLCSARSILRKHVGKVVLLDEAMSSVDDHTKKVMMEILEAEFSEHTVISVVHDLDIVRNYDTVVLLDDGKIVRKGAPSEMLVSH